LKAQLGVIRPQVIVGLGKVACSTLLRNHTPITKLRGTWQSYEGVDLMPTYHPSYLLRTQADKARAWLDLCRARAIVLGAASGAAGGP
jgi:DNA polymerase